MKQLRIYMKHRIFFRIHTIWKDSHSILELSNRFILCHTHTHMLIIALRPSLSALILPRHKPDVIAQTVHYHYHGVEQFCHRHTPITFWYPPRPTGRAPAVDCMRRTPAVGCNLWLHTLQQTIITAMLPLRITHLECHWTFSVATSLIYLHSSIYVALMHSQTFNPGGESLVHNFMWHDTWYLLLLLPPGMGLHVTTKLVGIKAIT